MLFSGYNHDDTNPKSITPGKNEADAKDSDNATESKYRNDQGDSVLCQFFRWTWDLFQIASRVWCGRIERVIHGCETLNQERRNKKRECRVKRHIE